MAKTKISEWSTTPSSNTDIDGINIAEGCAPSGINDAIRDMMAQIRSWQSGTYGDAFNGPVNGTIGATTPSTGAFTTLSASSTLSVTGVATLGAGAILNTPASVTLTNATGLPLTTGTTGTLATTKGGTGLTSFTANGVVYASSSSALATGSALTFDGSSLSVIGGGSIKGNKSSTGQFLAFVAQNSTQNYGTYIDQDNAGSNSWSLFDTTNSQTALRYYPSSSGYWQFYQNGSEQMRLTSTGLGIGTSSPSQKLEVAGNAKLTGTNLSIVPSTATSAAYLLNTNTGGNFFLGIDSSTGASFTGTAYGRFLYSGGAYPMVFLTNDTERMRLDSSGNLGLGVTPSAWYTTGGVSKWLEMPNGVSFGDFGGSSTVGNNWYANSAGTDIYKITGYAAQYVQTSGTHVWKIAPSGTAGNAITFTQAATLTANGDYLVGTTTDSGSSSNTKKVVGGNFITFQNTATVPALGTATILTLSSSLTGVYIINANFGPQGNAIYGGMLIVVANSGSFRIVTNGSGANSALTLSGANVQITNALGVALDATGSAMFIGN